MADLRTVFVHGRPGPHPLHAVFARALGADFVPIDFFIRWHDRPRRRLRKVLSWLLCALLFPRLRSYQVLLTDSLHYLPAIMRRLGRLRPDQRVIAILSDETALFLTTGRYSRLTNHGLRWALGHYDAVLCLGEMQADLARALVDGAGRPRIIAVRGGGVLRARQAALGALTPALDEPRIVFVGHGPGEWRGWYKGLDLVLHAVGLAARRRPELHLRVIGDWEPEYVRSLQARIPDYPKVEFINSVWDMATYARHLAEASLYVHLGRGDAFPISVLEAMSAGLPAIVSDWTGTSEAVARADQRLVASRTAENAAERIVWYYGLPSAERQVLSARCRAAAMEYSEEAAVTSFVDGIRGVLRELSLAPAAEAPGPNGSERGR